MLPAPTAPKRHLSSTIFRRASHSAIDEENIDIFPTISACFVLGCQCFIISVGRQGWYLETSAETREILSEPKQTGALLVPAD
jgi:hypothetical protein